MRMYARIVQPVVWLAYPSFSMINTDMYFILLNKCANLRVTFTPRLAKHNTYIWSNPFVVTMGLLFQYNLCIEGGGYIINHKNTQDVIDKV